MQFRSVCSAALIAAIATCSQAADLFVPGTYATIQAAVDAATNGDVVQVNAAGTYAGDVTVTDKNIGINGVSGVIVAGRILSQGTSVLAVSNLEVAGASFDGVQQSSAGPLTLTNVVVRNNPGRGLYHTVATTVTLIGGGLNNNGFDGYNSPAQDSVLIATNTTFNNNGRKGFFEEGNSFWKATLTGCTLANNNEDNFIAGAAGTLVATGTTISNASGGFAQVRFDGNASPNRSSATFTNCTFSGTTSNGSLWFIHPVDATVTNSSFTNSFRGIAFDGNAGGSTLDVSGSTFTGLTYRGIGTGSAVTATIDDSHFSNNERAIEFGGSASTVTVTSTSLTGNTSAGILISGSGLKDVTLEDVTIRGTTAGSALDFSGTSHTLTVSRSHFVDGSGATQYLIDAQSVRATFTNSVFDGGSYLVRQEGANAFTKLFYCTLVSGNNASTVGFFAQTQNAGNELVGNIIDGTQYGIAAATGVTVVNHHNLINATVANFDVVTPGASTLTSVSPLFVVASTGPGTGDLQLQSTSPALGVGLELGLTEDVTGGQRPLPSGSNPDLGAYENLLVPVELSVITLD